MIQKEMMRMRNRAANISYGIIRKCSAVLLSLSMITTLGFGLTGTAVAEGETDPAPTATRWQAERMQEAQSADHVLAPGGDMWSRNALILPGDTIAVVPTYTAARQDNGKDEFTAEILQLDNATGDDIYMYSPDGEPGDAKVLFTPLKTESMPIPFTDRADDPVVKIDGELSSGSVSYTRLYRYDGDHPVISTPYNTMNYKTSTTLNGFGYNENNVVMYRAWAAVYSAPRVYNQRDAIDLSYERMDTGKWRFAEGAQLPDKIYVDDRDHTYTFPIPASTESGKAFDEWQVDNDLTTLEEFFTEYFYISEDAIERTDDAISITLNMSDRIAAHGLEHGHWWPAELYPGSKDVPAGDSKVIDYMDIGSVWTQLSPFYGVAFTTALDRAGLLYDQVQIIDQYWKDTATGREIHADGDLPEYGHSYEFFIILKPKEGYRFDNEKFDTFIFEGNPVAADQYTKTLNPDGTVTMHWGYVKPASEDLSKQRVTCGTTNFTYNGKAKQPSVSIKTANGKTLVKGTDYDVYWRNSKGDWLRNAPATPGTYCLWIQGMGRYDNYVTRTFKISLARVSILTPKPGYKKVTVKWKKATGGVYYQIGYRKKGSKTWKYTTSKTTYKTIKKLKSRKYYYVKVRACKKVGTAKYYGAWSAIKRVKIK